VRDLATEESKRKTRRIAFVVITLVFVVSIAALLYWAVNVATARLNGRTIKQLQASPQTIITETRTTIDSCNLATVNGAIKF
jgi:hypothetical protein